ncbi:MAG: bifunctional lysylphosphatidylglycerol flippase/synthetase MprF [Myxococcota bacterium]|nr:bifunctional lysylphosphatidylglycerol flippase/synthetase MprF [Myxococcota bacterium]
MTALIRRSLRPLLGVALFLLALGVLDKQLEAHSLAQVRTQLRAISDSLLLAAIGFAVVSYITLTFYDLLALRYVGRSLAYPKVGITSFIAYVFSMDMGLTVLGSSAIRYRLYTIWGLKAGDIAQIVAFSTFTFFVGVLAVGGPLFLFGAIDLPAGLALPLESTRPIGVVFSLGFVLLLLAGARKKKSFSFRGFELSLPSVRLILLTVGVAATDWLLASAVLWTLLPEATGLDFLTFMAIFMACEVLGLASTVPAGLGVFEGIAMLLLAPYAPAPAILAALLAWRVIYFLLPIFIAISALGIIEALQHRSDWGRLREWGAPLTETILPSVLAAGILISGVLLVLAGVIPGEASRLAALQELSAFTWVELSHPLALCCGLSLIFVARGVQQRVDVAYRASLFLLVLGAGASLLHGGHPFFVGALGLTLLGLIPSRRVFDRSGSLLPAAFPPGFVGLLGIGLLALLGLVGWVYEDQAYSHALWAQVGGEAHFPRALRALALVGGVGIVVAGWRVSRPRAVVAAPAGEAELESARPLVEAAPDSAAHLALLGDKSLLFGSQGDGFLMYGVSGRSWVSMGDPVGSEATRSELAWKLRELSDASGGWPVFYEVGPENLPLYLDLGLSIHKLGEMGRVSLENFSLEGSSRKGLRQTLRRAERDGCSFEVIPKAGVPGLIEDLTRVSDAWLSEKKTREKSFSLGSFRPDYLGQMPLAVIRQAGEIVAFANLWLGGEQDEASPDLMRFDPARAPGGAMDFLFIECMLWAQAQGYRWFSLGMAPLSGLAEYRHGIAWNRFGSMLFRHGEHFYNFQGLRRYKEKYGPTWEARYMASPGGMNFPLALANISSLVSGGIGGTLHR